MANYKIRINLQALEGAFVTDLKGKTGLKKCLVIPIDSRHLYFGTKGTYLNLSAHEMKEERYGDTHCVKVDVDKKVYDSMNEEERKSIPIIGGMHEAQLISKEERAKRTTEDTDDEMPF